MKKLMMALALLPLMAAADAKMVSFNYRKAGGGIIMGTQSTTLTEELVNLLTFDGFVAHTFFV